MWRKWLGCVPKNEIRRFVIIAVPRTGSNYLSSLLHSHHDILCHTELFNPDRIWLQVGLESAPLKLGTMAERDSDPQAFLASVWSQPLGHKAVGLKLLSWQNRRVERLLLLDHSVRKIILTRRNELKSYVSLLQAQQTRAWGFAGGGQPAAPPPVTVTVAGLRENIRRNGVFYRRILRTVKWTRQPYLQVAYEDLFDEAEIGRILAFIGVEPFQTPPQSRFKKQSRRTLRDRIANYDDLQASLQGTPLLAHLEEQNSTTGQPDAPVLEGS
jgi:LPS sulfotransferase NodH